MEKFVGKYKHEKSDNLDEYFKSVGVPYLVRSMVTRSNPDVEIAQGQQDGEWKISTKSLIRTAEKIFKFGQEYVEQMPGKQLKATTTFENEKIVTNLASEEGIKTMTTYELVGDQLILTMVYADVEAKRYFKKQ